MFVITAPVCRQGLESISNLILNKNRYSVIPAYAGIRLINNIQRNVIPAKAGIQIDKYHTGLSLYSKH